MELELEGIIKKIRETFGIVTDEITNNNYLFYTSSSKSGDENSFKTGDLVTFKLKELSNLKEYSDFYEDGLLEINFYGLERQNQKKLKIHDRLFLCDQFSLQLNDGFYSEPDLHNEYTLITDTKRIEKFDNIYSKDSEEFYINFKFSLDDINF